MMAEGRRARAERHVREGRVTVARQRALVAKLKASGHDTTASQSLLDAFECSLAAFEEHLALILREA